MTKLLHDGRNPRPRWIGLIIPVGMIVAGLAVATFAATCGIVYNP